MMYAKATGQPCLKDGDCTPQDVDTYCLNGRCDGHCLPCGELYHRQPPAKGCAKSPGDCGPCLPGTLAEELVRVGNTGRHSDFCVPQPHGLIESNHSASPDPEISPSHYGSIVFLMVVAVVVVLAVVALAAMIPRIRRSFPSLQQRPSHCDNDVEEGNPMIEPQPSCNPYYPANAQLMVGNEPGVDEAESSHLLPSSAPSEEEEQNVEAEPRDYKPIPLLVENVQHVKAEPFIPPEGSAYYNSDENLAQDVPAEPQQQLNHDDDSEISSSTETLQSEWSPHPAPNNRTDIPPESPSFENEPTNFHQSAADVFSEEESMDMDDFNGENLAQEVPAGPRQLNDSHGGSYRVVNPPTDQTQNQSAVNPPPPDFNENDPLGRQQELNQGEETDQERAALSFFLRRKAPHTREVDDDSSPPGSPQHKKSKKK